MLVLNNKKYELQYLLKEPRAVFCRIFYILQDTPLNKEEIGNVAAFFDLVADAEGKNAHWEAWCSIVSAHLSKELIEGIGIDLLEHTSCTEPFQIIAFGRDNLKREFKEYGNVWTEK